MDQGIYVGPNGERHGGKIGRKAKLQQHGKDPDAYFAQWVDDRRGSGMHGWWTIPKSQFKAAV